MPYGSLFGRRPEWRGSRIDQLYVRSSPWYLGQYHGVAWGVEDTDCFAFDPDRHTLAKAFVACDLIAGCGSRAGGGDTAFVTGGGRLYWVEKGGARWRTRDLRGAPDEQTVVPAIDSAAPNFTEPYSMSGKSAM